MRAYHMPSLPEMPLEHHDNGGQGIADIKQMKLKVLYSLDDNTNFLARSQRLSQVKTARIPIPGQQNIMTLGVVDIRDALEPVFLSSPELFNDVSWDYSVYVKDISEEDEPFVGHGLISKLMGSGPSDFEDEQLVPGRVCSNFAAMLTNKFSSETLEIKLRFAKVKRQGTPYPQQPPPQSQQQQMQSQPQLQQRTEEPQQQQQPLAYSQQSKITKKPYRRSSLSQQHKSDKDSSDTENEYEEPKFIQPKPPHPQQHPPTAILPKMTRFVNNNPAPKAARTQSLPVFENMMKPPPSNIMGKPIEAFPPDSIALRIYMADKGKSNIVGGSSSEFNQANVAKRFSSDFMKSPNPTPSKKKSRKNNNISSVTHVSPNAAAISSNRKIPEEHQLYQSCFNCKTMEAKSWKWNESDDLSKRGLLCSLCFVYLRDKGIMRPKKLFTRTAKPKDRGKNQTSSSPTSNIGNDTTPATTPIRFYNNSKANENLPSSSFMDNSSDPMNEFEDIMNMNDLDFQYGPLTDIDPLPPQQQDKENIPPPKQSQSIASQLQEYHNQKPKRQITQGIQQPSTQHQMAQHQLSPIKATKQTSFEKMLTKSFSGTLPVASNGMSPSEWMNNFFAEPTPKDPSPKDSPKDITTCNTLPCNGDSPDQMTPAHELKEKAKSKVTTMPSSPFLGIQEEGSN